MTATTRTRRISALPRLTMADVDFSIIVHPEDTPIRGNVQCISPAADRRAERRVMDALEWNQWAWCTVEVRAEYGDFSASDFLGCCSYDSERDFRQPGGYYEDMKHEALDRLNEELAGQYSALVELIPAFRPAAAVRAA
jgi:hypothetical protein